MSTGSNKNALTCWMGGLRLQGFGAEVLLGQHLASSSTLRTGAMHRRWEWAPCTTCISVQGNYTRSVGRARHAWSHSLDGQGPGEELLDAPCARIQGGALGICCSTCCSLCRHALGLQARCTTHHQQLMAPRKMLCVLQLRQGMQLNRGQQATTNLRMHTA